MSTRVRLTNSSVSGLGASYRYYIELYAMKIEFSYSNDIIAVNKPVTPGRWLSGGAPVIQAKWSYDLKRATKQFQVNAKVERDSNKTSGWVTSELLSPMRVYDRIQAIAETGGVVTLELYDGIDTRTKTGMITNLGYTEEPQGHEDGTNAPPNLIVQFTFAEMVNRGS
jgi:hypothetical protein